MARYDPHWETAGEINARQVVGGLAGRERSAFIRFLAGKDGWQQASRQLSGAFAEPPAVREQGEEEE